MNSNQKFWSGLFLGAAAGTAIALFLSSDKGKEVLADAKDTADKLGKDIKSKLADLDNQFKSLMEKGKTIAEEVENQVAETIIS
jgi:gas vesicle protein